MTTNLNIRIGFAASILLITMHLFNPTNALAQNEESNNSTSTEVVALEENWFEIEKLNGNNFNQGDFVVGPGKAEVEVKPGETIVYKISVSNRISDGRLFDISVEDIDGTDDASQPVVLLGDEVGPYTIKDYIKFPKQSFKLDLGERAQIPVTITVPPNASPGGYYGSVLISTTRFDETVNEETGNTTRSPVVARIGTIFFITVPGDVEKNGETKELALKDNKWWYEKGPIDFGLLYENKGSMHLNPYGEVRVKNIFNEEVGFVELEPWFVLPNSLRNRDISWDREVMLGRYTATAYINRGYDDIVDEVSVSFWVLPWKVVGGVFLVVFIIFFSIRTFFRKFEFKRKG